MDFTQVLNIDFFALTVDFTIFIMGYYMVYLDFAVVLI